MSTFGNFLMRHLQSRQHAQPTYTAGQFAEDLGITPPMLSRLFTDDTQTCRRPTLTKICMRISDDPVIQAETQAAYLRDHVVDPGRDYLRLGVSESSRVKEAATDGLDDAASAAALDPKTIAALRSIIEKCATSPRLKRVVLDWGALARNDL